MADSSKSDQAEVVDLDAFPTARTLVNRCLEFFEDIKNLTPGHGLEAHLNSTYGPTSPIYTTFSTLIHRGLSENWVATTPLDGPIYRRGKIARPTPDNSFFSITTVWMDSQGPEVYSGQHHGHPYGEINCVIPIDEGAELKGMQGWQGKGWTSPGPGTHHFPQVRGGRLVALFFLPAGRIAYDVDPETAQPVNL